MRLASEQEMIEILGCTKAAFDGYLENNVFAPCIRAKKRGRPCKNENKGAVYNVDIVQKEVSDFQAGKFAPQPLVEQARGDSSEDTNVLDDACGVSESKAGEVIRFNYGNDPKDPTKKENDFDYATIIGDISTLKKLRAKIIEVTPRMDVPLSVKKNLKFTFELMEKSRERREARKKKVTVEKWREDLQTVFNTCMSAWSGEIGQDAAISIVEDLERSIGQSLRKQHSNIIQIVHRCIVAASNQKVQPLVLKVLGKL